MRWRPDPLIAALLTAALIGSFLPATGQALDVLRSASVVLIAGLFFLYGTRLSTAETLTGLGNWRLQLAVLVTTFVVFPLLGLGTQVFSGNLLTPSLASGVLLLCLVPSTVQACVVYTQIAGGNVAGAVVGASLSSMLGVFVTPALVALLMTANTQVDTGSVVRIVLQLLVPFVLGQLVRPVVGGVVNRHAKGLGLYDRGSIVLVVFIAFSEGAEADIWSNQSVWSVLAVAVACAVLLAVAIGWTVLLGRAGGFSHADRVTILFCGSTKSLASGLPIAAVLFSGDDVALIVLPLMLYHQMQIITGALLAPRLNRRGVTQAR